MDPLRRWQEESVTPERPDPILSTFSAIARGTTGKKTLSPIEQFRRPSPLSLLLGALSFVVARHLMLPVI